MNRWPGGIRKSPSETVQALDYTLSLCQRMGFHTKNADGLYGYAEIGEGAEIIGCLGHLDVVPAGDGWHYPPYAGTIDGGRLYGRGTIDDKGVHPDRAFRGP